jgi:glucose-6-phosphate 1-dehydrogenase
MCSDEFRVVLANGLREYLPKDRLEGADLERFLMRAEYLSLDATKSEQIGHLCAALEGRPGAPLFYLATSPSLYGPICERLAACGLAQGSRGVVLEKPIGRDLESSKAINDGVAAAFNEERIFRIDHYLGKETVQNLIALRFGNSLFEPLWNASSIEQVQITIAETVGVEGRWAYFNESGTLRDMVQNHLLQLLCFVAMEPPAVFDPHAVRNEKIKVLRSLKPIEPADAVAGQYGAGAVNGKPAPAYVQEAGGVASNTETFVALRADIGNWRWAGVPFFLRTGKRMPDRRTEIVIQFREVPFNIFGPSSAPTRNTLRIRLQPEETVELTLMSKEPGLAGMHLRPVTLNLSLTEAFQNYRRRIAYERLILDALNGVTTLFVRRDEVEAAWEWVDRISEGWARSAPKLYSAGTWGPSAAFGLIERAGYSWAD